MIEDNLSLTSQKQEEERRPLKWPFVCKSLTTTDWLGLSKSWPHFSSPPAFLNLAPRDHYGLPPSQFSTSLDPLNKFDFYIPENAWSSNTIFSTRILKSARRGLAELKVCIYFFATFLNWVCQLRYFVDFLLFSWSCLHCTLPLKKSSNTYKMPKI